MHLKTIWRRGRHVREGQRYVEAPRRLIVKFEEAGNGHEAEVAHRVLATLEESLKPAVEGLVIERQERGREP